MTQQAIESDPLAIAEGYVREALAREFFEQAPPQHGDKIDVDNMNECDCVPLVVTMDHGPAGDWRLVGCKMKPHYSRILGRMCYTAMRVSATYEFNKRQR